MSDAQGGDLFCRLIDFYQRIRLETISYYSGIPFKTDIFLPLLSLVNYKIRINRIYHIIYLESMETYGGPRGRVFW